MYLNSRYFVVLGLIQGYASIALRKELHLLGRSLLPRKLRSKRSDRRCLQGNALGDFEERTELRRGNSESASGEAVNVGGVDAYDLAAQVQDGSSAASAGR